VAEAIGQALEAPRRRIEHAASIGAAERTLAEQAIDLVLLDVALPAGDGMALARKLQRTSPLTRSIVITAHASLACAIDAMRSGAVDFIAKPLNVDELNERVAAAMKHQRHDRRRDRQFTRLRKLCKHLNQARHEITDQVDILCNDLVTAYQDLAGQVNQIERSSELRAQLAEELDLEQVLRRAMEHLLDKIGPSNIIVFLPASSGGFTVGGYVNYSDATGEQLPLVEPLPSTAAERLMADGDCVELADQQQIESWLQTPCGWLADMHLIGVPCVDGAGEPLAGLIMFRPADEPFDERAVQTLTAAAPVLTDQLIKVIHVHHRTKQLFDDQDDDGGLMA
jgi:FixJ family two-component response regulator